MQPTAPVRRASRQRRMESWMRQPGVAAAAAAPSRWRRQRTAAVDTKDPNPLTLPTLVTRRSRPIKTKKKSDRVKIPRVPILRLATKILGI
jgi:hypothetical protein